MGLLLYIIIIIIIIALAVNATGYIYAIVAAILLIDFLMSIHRLRCLCRCFNFAFIEWNRYAVFS